MLDLQGTSAEEDTVRTRIQAEVETPFDLQTGPLFRITLLKLDDSQHLLILNMHHIISDGWSMEIFMRESAQLYRAFSAGAENPLPPLTIQYADFAVWQQHWLQAGALAQ